MSASSNYFLKDHRCENCASGKAVPRSSMVDCLLDPKKTEQRVCWWSCKKWNEKKAEKK